jgi:16S rRNA pseudouridine516 synthase
MRLDRFLTRLTHLPCKQVSRLIADGQVTVDGEVKLSGLQKIDRFSRVEMQGMLLQAEEAVYLMLHKPAGYLSATTDPLHPTVIDLIDHPLKHELHLAGRLDRASTGLLLLTNDGRWSKLVTEPLEEIPKVYRVTTLHDIAPETASRFAEGIYFAYEDLTTRPALLEILGEREALMTIHEGRYHQVKRMFHAAGNRVTSLHRENIGHLRLGALASGEWRHLDAEEIALFRR